jgi:hypothetical protein
MIKCLINFFVSTLYIKSLIYVKMLISINLFGIKQYMKLHASDNNISRKSILRNIYAISKHETVKRYSLLLVLTNANDIFLFFFFVPICSLPC